MKFLASLAFLLTVVLLSGCDEKEKPMVKYEVNGFVQKGPFVLGSTVTIIELNGNYEPTGRTFSTTTTDDLGSFNTSVALTSSKAEIIATGYYFNEVSGSISDGPLTLRAIVDLDANATINLNVLTTITEPRIRALTTTGGHNFADAKAQAENELLTGIGATSTDHFETLNVTSNALLLAFSAVIQHNRKVGEMTQLLNKIAADFGATATISSASRETLSASAAQVSPYEVQKNLTKRYQDLGVPVAIPAFEEFIELFLVGGATGVPSITAITPPMGIPGDTVVITGRNFSAELGKNHVYFSQYLTTYTAQLISSTTGSITFIAPNLADSAYVYVAVDGHDRMATATFVRAPLTITGFQPTTGLVGDVVTISGGPFPLNKYNAVKFGSISATIVEGTRTTLKIKVPDQAPAISKIIVESANRKATADGEFALTPPTVTSISPNVVSIGDLLEINGTGFQRSAIEVRIDGKRTNPVSFESNKITVNVPAVTIYSGRTVEVTVTSNGQPVTSPMPLQIDGWIGVATVQGTPARGFAMGGKGYAGLGFAASFWSFNPANHTFSPIAPFPVVYSQQSASFVINGKAFVSSGPRAAPWQGFDFYTYDPQQNTWTNATRMALDMNSPRVSLAGAVSANGKAYVMTSGGLNGAQNFWEYDPVADQWSPKANKPGGDPESTFELNGKVYVYSRQASASIPAAFWEYDPETSTWTSKAVPGDVGVYEQGFSNNGFGYMLTGNGLWQYSPGTNSWSNITIPKINIGPGSLFFKIDDKIYLGKETSISSMILYEYDLSLE